jgi:hypothetical protein
MTVKAGETRRIECSECGEFDVTYEPKAKGKKEAGNIVGVNLDCCPACGEGLIDNGDDD